MRQRLANRDRGFLKRGALLSLLVHANLLVPIGIVVSMYARREEARRAEEIDVAFEDVRPEELPPDLPPLDSTPSDPLPAPEPPQKKPKQELAREEEKPERKPEPPKPPDKPELAVPQPPEPEKPPPPPEIRKAHEKIVELDDDKEDVPPPPNASYLAQRNSRAEVETRATDTALQKSQHPERNEMSAAEKQKIAELEEQASAAGRQAPEVTPHENPEAAASKPIVPPDRPSPLVLRDPARRVHELTPETVDPSLPKAPDGELAMATKNARGAKSNPARDAPGKQVKLALSGRDYEYLFGAEAEAERRLAQKERSTKLGKAEIRRARVQAALENFIPEVRPGNTTALNARAAPFAAYIARMHRSIHKHWGFGQLEDWDDLPGSSPFNRRNLQTTLEMVLNRDGTIDKVTIVRASGYLPYDAAVIDVAYTAGPYPDPPKEIRSPNGKIYVHWTFHRDERQCTPAFTEYFIIDKPSEGADRAPVAEGEHPGQPRPLGAASGGASQPAAADGEPSVPRRLERFESHGHRGRGPALSDEVAAADPREAPPARRSAQALLADPSDPGALAIAHRWFGALAAGDARTVAAISTLPFKTSGREVTRRETLAAMVADLIREEGAAGGAAVRVYTAAGLRGALGKLPAGLVEGSDQLYAVASLGSRDALILILAHQGGIWRAAGLVRR